MTIGTAVARRDVVRRDELPSGRLGHGDEVDELSARRRDAHERDAADALRGPQRDEAGVAHRRDRHRLGRLEHRRDDAGPLEPVDGAGFASAAPVVPGSG